MIRGKSLRKKLREPAQAIMENLRVEADAGAIQQNLVVVHALIAQAQTASFSDPEEHGAKKMARLVSAWQVQGICTLCLKSGLCVSAVTRNTGCHDG